MIVPTYQETLVLANGLSLVQLPRFLRSTFDGYGVLVETTEVRPQDAVLACLAGWLHKSMGAPEAMCSPIVAMMIKDHIAKRIATYWEILTDDSHAEMIGSFVAVFDQAYVSWTGTNHYVNLTTGERLDAFRSQYYMVNTTLDLAVLCGRLYNQLRQMRESHAEQYPAESASSG